MIKKRAPVGYLCACEHSQQFHHWEECSTHQELVCDRCEADCKNYPIRWIKMEDYHV